MNKLSDAFILGIFPLVLLVSLILFYVLSAAMTGNVFRREGGHLRPFAFSEPFTRPFGLSMTPDDLWSTWINTSYWAWPFNAFSRTNPYIFLFLVWGVYFSVFVYQKLKLPSNNDEEKREIRNSIIICGVGTFLELLVFSVLLYLFFSSPSIKEFHF